MQRTTKIFLALLLAAVFVGLIVPAALTQGVHRGDKGRGAWVPDELYHVMKITGTSGSGVTFDILGTAVKGKDGSVAVMTMDTPRHGTYFFANDTAVIPFANRSGKGHNKPVMGDYSNATIPVAGASGVVALKNVTMTGKGRGNIDLQFTNVGIYLPNGTALNYPLSSPGRVMKSADNSSMLIIGNPSLRAALQGSLTSGATFPANANPVLLKAVDGLK